MKELKLALLGFGNAGQAFGRMLLEHEEEIMKTYDTKVMVTAIATGSRGNLVCSEGIDLARALADLDTEKGGSGRFTDSMALSTMTTMEIVEWADFDVLVEMTPLNIATGQPAISHIEGAFKRGKHVVTANKGPIAWAYRRLRDMAKMQGFSSIMKPL